MNLSLCSKCKKIVSVKHLSENNKEYLEKHCDECGTTRELISNDSEQYRQKRAMMADTDYPGITFTNIEGASIMDEPANKKLLRQMRKPWGLGLNIGYGAIVDVKNGSVATGPYVGFGISYSPKFLQWGK